MNPVGRPKKKLNETNWEKVELYFRAGASQKKISTAMGMSGPTFRLACEEKYGETYNDICESFRQTGELLIEAMQFQKALQGNVQLLIWLGKVRCGQRDADAQNNLAPYHDSLAKDHMIMELKNRISEMKTQLDERDENKSKTGQELL